MDIRSLVQFLQIAKDGSFTKAAASLYLAQPTLSKTIRNLEDELDVQLFQKNKQHIQLTDYGRQLVKISTPIVNEFQQISRWIYDCDALAAGPVNVGVTPMLASLYLISQISAFCKEYPNISLNFSERGTNDIKTMVEASECDLGLCMNGQAILDSSVLDVYPLFSKEVVALIPSNNPLSTRTSIQISDLRHEKFNFYTEGHAIKDAVYSRCKDAGFIPKVNFVSGNTSLLIKLSETGSGITILPKAFLSVHKCSNLTILPFDPVFPWNCCLIVKKNRYQSFAVKKFISYVMESFAQLQ